jgi:transposase
MIGLRDSVFLAQCPAALEACMDVKEREVGDCARLEAMIEREKSAKQRDRLRFVLLALRGWEALDIAEALSSNRRTVQAWVYRYRDGGIAHLTPRKARGARPLLPPEQHEAFRQRIINGPRESDEVCTLRGRDAQQILREEFGVVYKLSSVYELMHRLGLSCLKPRPRHEDSNPAAMKEFAEKSAPFLFAPCEKQSSHAADASA